MTVTNPPDRIIELDELTCRQLLGSHAVGRLAFNAEPSPIVLPVNYALHGEYIVFRTAAGAKKEAAERGQTATFQVDGLHAERHSAWSVMVRGRLEAIHDENEFDASPEPLPGGERFYRVRLRIDDITGRRIPPEQGLGLPSRAWYRMDASDLMGG